MRRTGRYRVLPLVGASVLTAAVVAILATRSLISPEWFFGAPLIGVLLSSIWVARRDGFAAPQVSRPREESERFVLAHRLLEAEREIAHRRSQEIRDTLARLEQEREPPSLYEYLGRDYFISHLREVEAERVEAERKIEDLVRQEALAHARLIVRAQSQGIPEAHERDPFDLVREVVRGKPESR